METSVCFESYFFPCRCVTNFDQHQPTSNDQDLLLAYQQAKEALNLRTNERVERYYTCVDSDEDDCDIGIRNTKENDQNDEDCMVKVILNLYMHIYIYIYISAEPRVYLGVLFTRVTVNLDW